MKSLTKKIWNYQPLLTNSLIGWLIPFAAIYFALIFAVPSIIKYDNGNNKLIGIILAVFSFIFTGAILGSYWITIYSRLKHGVTVLRINWKKFTYETPQSQCLGCGTRLSPNNVIPIISYLVYRGKCKYCHTQIGWSTLAAELIGGLIGLEWGYVYISKLIIGT